MPDCWIGTTFLCVGARRRSMNCQLAVLFPPHSITRNQFRIYSPILEASSLAIKFLFTTTTAKAERHEKTRKILLFLLPRSRVLWFHPMMLNSHCYTRLIIILRCLCLCLCHPIRFFLFLSFSAWCAYHFSSFYCISRLSLDENDDLAQGTAMWMASQSCLMLSRFRSHSLVQWMKWSSPARMGWKSNCAWRLNRTPIYHFRSFSFFFCFPFCCVKKWWRSWLDVGFITPSGRYFSLYTGIGCQRRNDDFVLGML